MLAMMSCIFSEPAARQPVANALMQLKQQDLPMPMKSPAFSLDYYASEQAAWSLFQSRHSSIAVAKAKVPSLSWNDIDHPAGTYGSTTSSNGPWTGDLPLLSEPVTPYSTGSTPPRLVRSTTSRSNYPHSYSTSPDNSALRRVNTNPFLSFAAFQKPFTLTGISPPTERTFRDDEADLSTSAPASAVTWGETTVYNASDTTESGSPETRRRSRQFSRTASDGTFDVFDASDSDDDDSSFSSDDDQLDTRSRTSRPQSIVERPSTTHNFDVKIKVTMKNQNMFDDEAHVSVPLLDPADTAKYVAYRAGYAEYLSIWQLPIARSEILKFNGMTSYWPEDMPFLQKEDQDKLDQNHRVVDKTGVGAVTFAKRKTSKDQTVLQCSICWQPVAGLHVSCDTCGVGRAHKECAEAWNEELGEEESWCDSGLHDE